VESSFIDTIRSLSVEQRFGAAQIAELAADVLRKRAAMGEASSPDAFRQEILHTGWDIIRANPTMAPLINLVSAVMWKLEQAETPRQLRDAVANVTSDFKRQQRQQAVHVAENALPLIDDGATVITHSISTTVQYALLHAQRAGRRFEVICGESRPACEGRQMAQSLSSSGVPVRLMTDAAAIAMVPRARLVLVGADSLSHEGLVNKIGTFGLATVARAHDVPFYTLCGSTKFLPHGYRAPQPIDWPSSEVWDAPAGQLSIENPYFDMTPLDLISGIVTERGTLPSAGAEGWIAALQLHSSLLPSAAIIEHDRALT
jgi:translation initiation factor 2B subunit (eIF-2B alpha/beta/delta family)